MYVDGRPAGSGTGLKTGHVIPHGGTVVLGQDQDSLGGGFGLGDAFGPGQVTQVNMWSRILSQREIANQYGNCHIPQGSVHQWSQFRDTQHGEVLQVQQ